MRNSRAKPNAEDRFFKRAQTTEEVSKVLIDDERTAVRKKTARLKEERLAKKAATGVTEIDKKPTSPKRRRS